MPKSTLRKAHRTFLFSIKSDSVLAPILTARLLLLD